MVSDIVSEAREFRLAMARWAIDGSGMRHLPPPPGDAEVARAAFRRWSDRYFAPIAATVRIIEGMLAGRSDR